jgi:hypothetical protein
MLTDLGMSSALVRIEGLDRKTVGRRLHACWSTIGALLGARPSSRRTPLDRAAASDMPELPGVLSGMTVRARSSASSRSSRARCWSAHWPIPEDRAHGRSASVIDRSRRCGDRSPCWRRGRVGAGVVHDHHQCLACR